MRLGRLHEDYETTRPSYPSGIGDAESVGGGLKIYYYSSGCQTTDEDHQP